MEKNRIRSVKTGKSMRMSYQRDVYKRQLLAVFEDKIIGSFTVITVMICKIFLIHIAVAFLFEKIIGCVFFYQFYKLFFFCAAIPLSLIHIWSPREEYTRNLIESVL